jgi:hypothetical protein
MAPEQARDTRQASLASDVFSLGATLLFAATGHAPYQGETVMDILVRLATEPPDLTGLPAELTDIVAACLERSPRKRPTSAAVLAQLAPYVEGTSGPGPPPLPGPAIALIAEYQRHPQPSVAQAADEVSDDATFGSRTALPAARRFPVRGWPLRRRGNGRGPGSGGGTTAAPRSRTARRRRKALTVAALACAAAALLAGGTVLGIVTKTNSERPRIGPPGPVPTFTSSTPTLAVSQSFGDANTVFVLHGSGWRAGQRVTVRLVGHGASRYPPTPDLTGTFNYAINEAHEFFPGQIPPGHYLAVVSQAGVGQMQVPFQVGSQSPNGPPPGGPPPGGPPPGGPPPGQ